MKSRYSFVVIAILGLTMVHLIGKPSHAAPLNQVNGLLLGASGPIPDGSETFAVWTSAGTVPVPAFIKTVIATKKQARTVLMPVIVFEVIF